jgi:hypothetical protein
MSNLLQQYKQNAPLTILRNRTLVKVEMLKDTYQEFKIYPRKHTFPMRFFCMDSQAHVEVLFAYNRVPS